MWGLLGGAAAVAIALFTWYNGGSEAVGGLFDAADGMSRHASSPWRFDEAWNNNPWTDDERRAQILRDGDGHQMVRAVGGVARVTLAAKSLAGSPSVPNAPAGLGFSDGQTISEIGVWAHGKLVGDASGDPTSEPGDPAESGTGADADGSARRPGATGEPADGTGTTPPTAHGTTDASDILGCYRFDVEAFRQGLPAGTTAIDISRTHLGSLCIEDWEDGSVRIKATIEVGLEVRDESGFSRADWVLSLENVEDPYRDGDGWGFTADLFAYQDDIDGMGPSENHLVTGTIRDGIVRIDEPYVLVWGEP